MIVFRKTLLTLPILTALTSAVTCVTSYLIALKVGEIDPPPFLAFISDTGDYKPQSSIFTLGLSLSCFFTFCIVVVRYYQIKVEHRARYNGVNKLGFCCGAVFVFGKLVVASFQLSSNKIVHFSGAGLYFLGACVYCGIQTFITVRHHGSKCVIVTRLICTIGMAVCVVLFTVFMMPGLTKHNRGGANVAQSAEWVLAICKTIFMVTFLGDFRGGELKIKVNFEKCLSNDADNTRILTIYDNQKKTFL